MSFTGRLRPAFVRLFGRPKPVVKVHQATALVPEGFIRQVGLTVYMPDPNKGGQNPPLREVTILFNPNDARIVAERMLADAIEADVQNEQTGEGGRYTGEYADVLSRRDTAERVSTLTTRVPKGGSWGRLYSTNVDFVEAQVTAVTDTEVMFTWDDGTKARPLPRTDADLRGFVTDDDNWETL